MAHSIPEDTITRIKSVANIVDIVSEYVVLKKAGRNFLGLCPFHAEKTPSFTVSPEKQIFYCFGCHTGGNLYSFIMQREGVSFPDAVRMMAGKYGIEIPSEDMPADQRQQLSEKDRIYRINEAAMVYFQRVLNDPQTGQKAMSYLLGRGMTRKIIDSHQLGYAPERWDGLLRHFQEKKAPADLLVKSGLVIPRKDGNGYYDRFRDRVIFPILNSSKQVIGFGGRVMGDALPKYLNSPETPVYNKRKGLYGIHFANRAARTAKKVFVVEGYFDVLAMHLYGIENSVATLGTALTPEHVQLLKGMVGPSGQVFLVYDSDQAGIKAAQRSVTVFEEGYLDARILILPRGHDPDTFLREFGPDDFHKAADGALGMIPFIIERAIAAHGLSVQGKIKAVAEVQGALAAIHDPVARSLYVKMVAERLDIDERAVLEKIREASNKNFARTPVGRPIGATPEPVGDRLEQQVLAMMLCYPKMIPEIVGRNLLDCFEDAQLGRIAQMVAEGTSFEREGAAGLVSQIEDPVYRNMVTQLAMDDCHWDRQGCERVLSQFDARRLRRQGEDLLRRIEAAEKDQDTELLVKLLRQKQKNAGKG